ncbi:Cytochrome c assembly protein [Flavobacterium saliperosum S13]|uniref:Cytochrome c-type biogenesis protein CcsB n=2 Tax=Flavobacterium saliperosum TaxID=329186 RepID=A0A1G4VDT9_9FLAO|nr:cytochrome c biogenesis protein CcsA [Flavobacterium saliperosum]ESU25872.1 Cytochrome c assembly protein [Flavobacterium saliperosum S13]SCX05203.1 cytochrome c-type biogenesis protein CcsB [Flavobacterium saliperosum]
MDKKIFSFLFSTRLMAVLFIVFAAAMAAGTFIENDYNTDTARILVYNARWFEVIMVFFVINFLGNIKRYQLLQKSKWASLLLHLSFILIIAGAFITRYISFEGMMPIREGEVTNQIFSDKVYLNVFVDGEYQGEMKRRTFEEPLMMSPITNNHFSISETFDEIPFEIEYKDFIMGAKEVIKEDPNGILFLKLVESGDGTRHEHYLKEGEVQNIHNILFAFNKFTPGAVNITKISEAYTIQAPFEGNFMRMADKFQAKVEKDKVQALMLRSLYNLGGAQFVIPEPAIKGKIVQESNGDYKDKDTDDALVLTVRNEGKEKEVTLVGSKGKMGVPQSFKLGNLEYTLIYGSKVYETPFKIKLNDFVAAKYPGTEKSYSSFESKVTVEDTEQKTKFDARIFMNNILDYRGYRFFQASFDPDEKGTVLSVNHDSWGTLITYIGYTLLYIGLMGILFIRGSRFGELKRKLEKIKEKKAALSIIALFFSFGMMAQHTEHQPQMPTAKQIDSLILKHKVSEEHAAKFGRMIVQDQGGRMKPVNTFSSELLRKVSKSDTYKDMNSDQVFLSMTQFPQVWYNVPIIFVKKGNDSIRKMIGAEKDAKYVSLMSFFDDRGNYKLSPYLDEAYKAPVPNQFQKDFIETDKKVNLLYSALSGQILKVFPIPFDKNNKWVSHLELNETGLTGIDSLFTKNVLPLYLSSLDEVPTKKDYKAADTFLDGLIKFQKKYGKEVYPSEEKIDSEILYNKYDIFKKLYSWYMIAGVLMFLFVIVKIFNSGKVINTLVKVSHGFIGLFFILHTIGLIARWYISGHAPWSDAYESMIYVGWATMFFGLAFGRKSELTVASTAFVAAMILMIAHWSWMDPAIANLQPVLNSYWLMIHVAVIVASYGPFTLGMILGIVSLLLILLTNEKNKKKMELNIKEITIINEMALTVGLVMLTIGNFLGGQWANESWGRYWGWDPKETWALISIMVYAFVIHMRFVPALRGKWIYNLVSVFAFYSILMTYFGVNFYLSGLHSYAKGDKVVTPNFVYVSVALVTLLGIASYFKYRKHYKK